MEPDGNCLFRCVADQLCGDAEEHQQLREECCDHMLEHAEEFQAFHADEDFEDEGVSFDGYVEQMRSPCKWGSQLELMAICRRNGINAIVHQNNLPPYEMVFAPLGARCLQLSYHDGEHYNSVRFASDMAPGKPARCLSLQQLRKVSQVDTDVSPEILQRVRDGLPTGHVITDETLRAALLEVGGDADSAAEQVLNMDFKTGHCLATQEPDITSGRGFEAKDVASMRSPSKTAADAACATGEEKAANQRHAEAGTLRSDARGVAVSPRGNEQDGRKEKQAEDASCRQSRAEKKERRRARLQEQQRRRTDCASETKAEAEESDPQDLSEEAALLLSRQLIRV
ncbi:unnamed protein product [Polarella glacialis]|nr:unnamed protein product [Polarella glacialis]